MKLMQRAACVTLGCGVALALCLIGGVRPLAAAEGDAKRPNFLFIIFDDWNGNHAGAYGCDWVKTPNFDRVAREGVLFRNCFTSNPKCSPCRASILTGRNTWQLEEACCHFGLFSAKFAVFPDLLEDSGYFIGLTGKGWGPGDWQNGGFKRNPAGPSFDKHRLTPPTKSISTLAYAQNFGEFLEQRPGDQPFFFWMGFTEPHRAYELDSGLRAGRSIEDVDVPAYLPDTPTVRRDLLDYAIEVEWGDSQIGETLSILEAAGELENTVVVITSDHGMPFPRVKGQIYEDGFHLPLAMRWPARVKANRTVDDFINVRDFAPTFLKLAGLAPHEQMTGRDFLDVLDSDGSGWIDRSRNVMLVGKERHDIGRPFDWGYPVRAIRTPEWLFSYNFMTDRWPAGNPETDYGNCDPSPTKELLKRVGGTFYELAFGKRPQRELYRIDEDPYCMRNLAADPYYAPVVKELEERMLAMLREEEDPRALGQGHIFEAYPYLGGRGKGYDSWLEAVDPTSPPAALEQSEAPPRRTPKKRKG